MLKQTDRIRGRRKAKFYIYRNLNHGKLFSIRYKGKVIDRLDDFIAYECDMKVNPSGRARTLAYKTKNVHAFVVTDAYETMNDHELINDHELKYNPYNSEYFQCDGKTIHYADAILFKNGKAYVLT